MGTPPWAPVIFSPFFFSFFFFAAGFLVGSSAGGEAFSPVDSYRIACGSPQKLTVHGQEFLPDTERSSFSLKSSGDGALSAAAAAAASLPSPIYQSLRFFPEPASYRFEIRRQGRHWVRLYFSPIAGAGSGHDLTAASITVVAGDFVLLQGFVFRGSGASFVAKEYSLNLTAGELVLTFLPSNGSVSFVNGIEVVSAPDELIADEAAALPAAAAVAGLSELSLETVFRLNVGGPPVTPENDTLGRTWESDEGYLHVNSSAARVAVDPAAIRYPEGGGLTTETAPRWVYATADAMSDANVTGSNFNITWVFAVDPGFRYVARLHFCDIVSKSMNNLVFNVYVNADLAIPSLDLSALKGALAVPYYRDFGGGELTVSVGPDPMADLSNAILNGLEVMKISNGAGSLGGAASARELLPEEAPQRRRRALIVAAAAGCSAALALAALCGGCCVLLRRRSRRAGGRPTPGCLSRSTAAAGCTPTARARPPPRRRRGRAGAAPPRRAARRWPPPPRAAASSPSRRSATPPRGSTRRCCSGWAASASGEPRSEQGLAEFHTEIQMLSKLRHRHLVSLIGYCDENREMILVYEYMANGPLRSHLYGAGLPPLPWRRRLEICIGAARGLHYLHTGAAQSIIHRDVKTTNILLDEDLVAKVADFGLSKAGPAIDQTHVSTAVKGSFGYLDPEYFRRQQLTEKSDVLCTRPALNPGLPREQANIAEWAMTWQKRGQLVQIMDQALAGKVNPASLRKYGETAEKCLAEHGVDRPSMGDVLWNLEYALQLEETSAAAAADDPGGDSTNHIAALPHLLDDPPAPPAGVVAAAAAAAPPARTTRRRHQRRLLPAGQPPRQVTGRLRRLGDL
ncbi:unnamed protein product [Spirodela intermedia]|uniref:Protein kinase domain-containing protein n=1 Tax=Spirodela intermedia TaxID=51605 RepID=A0A7I8IFS1_SPIIN|nr:unnamed protein product [Spirodela intermedia]CAA6656660.1 unnamed protein product [Spirodela intermedia]